jgi:phosphatidylserine/phosphatidylglycerophosphate/cardiolipin synthase-like enzyme
MFKLISSYDYQQTLISKIKDAHKYVYIQAMAIEFTSDLESLVDAIISASVRGIEVKINIDWYSKMYTGSHINKYPIVRDSLKMKVDNINRENKKYINMLIENNVKITYINKPVPLIGEYIPFVGRNHMKFILIDDSIFIGGINISKNAFLYVDFMVECQNSRLHASMIQIFENEKTNILSENKEIQILEDTDLLVDAGRIGQSLIYKRSLDLIDNATRSIEYISQFHPSIDILYAMMKAQKRGVDIKIITYDKKFANNKIINGIDNSLFYLFSNKINVKYHNEKYVHAKLIITDIDKDKGGTAIFGSHNFSPFGVFFATAEIALKTTHTPLVQDLHNWYMDTYNKIS